MTLGARLDAEEDAARWKGHWTVAMTLDRPTLDVDRSAAHPAKRWILDSTLLRTSYPDIHVPLLY
ncbi:MAG: hypothetical protein JWM47_4254 [Acidimicrobiales bacterium]|nr:hypothetical protein [Acidimicrobiales bacterium]